MRKYEFIRTAIFVSLFFILNFIFSTIYSKVIMFNSLVNRVERDFYNFDNKIQFLIMGDSHSQAAVNPDIISNAFNYSTAGECYIQTYYKLKHLLGEGKKQIETIILPIDPHSFSSYRATRYLTDYYWRKYIDYIELGVSNGNLFSCLLKAAVAKIFPYAGEMNSILRFLCGNLSSTTMNKGHIPNEDDFSKKREKSKIAKRRTAYHLKNHVFIDKTLFSYFQRTIDICLSNNIRVVLVKYPLHSHYYYHLSKLVPLRKLNKKIKKITNGHSSVIVLDYQKMFFDKDFLFASVDHLNPLGAKKLSEIMIKDLATQTFNQKDADIDGVKGLSDNCPGLFNSQQEDKDGDTIGDSCDTCVDTDWDGYGNPGYPNRCEQDNCPFIFNPSQEDADGDGIGNACEPLSKVENLWLEAEHTDTIVYPLMVANDNKASGGKYISSPNRTENQYTPGSIMATYKVNLSQTGRYILWGRVSVADKRDNSFFVQFDDDENNLWEIESGKNWHWDQVNNRNTADPVIFILTEGTHIIKVKLREDGTKLDKILLTNDTDFVPSGEGGVAENRVNPTDS